MDIGDFAIEVAELLDHTEFVKNHGWEILGLDTGEIEITTGDGERFRLTVSEIADDE